MHVSFQQPRGTHAKARLLSTVVGVLNTADPRFKTEFIKTVEPQTKLFRYKSPTGVDLHTIVSLKSGESLLSVELIGFELNGILLSILTNVASGILPESTSVISIPAIGGKS